MPQSKMNIILIYVSCFIPFVIADCWDNNKCFFLMPSDDMTHAIRMWNILPLCNKGNGYTFVNGSTTYKFEICGSIDPRVPKLPECNEYPCEVPSPQTFTYCNPDYNEWPYTGSLLAFFDPSPAKTCKYGRIDGQQPNSGCPNLGTSGQQNLPDLCCTGQCEVLAVGNSAINYRWINNNNLSYGIRWTMYGKSINNGGEFDCPIDPNTGIQKIRTTVVNLLCSNGKKEDPLVVNSIYDNGDCSTRVELSHQIGCGYEATCDISDKEF